MPDIMPQLMSDSLSEQLVGITRRKSFCLQESLLQSAGIADSRPALQGPGIDALATAGNIRFFTCTNFQYPAVSKRCVPQKVLMRLFARKLELSTLTLELVVY